MERVFILVTLAATTALPTLAQRYFPAPHSSKEQKEVIEAVLRFALPHRREIVFLKILGRDPSQELIQELTDLPMRILPASRARPAEKGGTSTLHMIPNIYKDQVSGREGLLFDVHTVAWPKEACVKMVAGYDGAPSAFKITLESNKWKVQPSGIKGMMTFEGFIPEQGSLALDVTCK
jgi:hypothetical protein